MIKLYDIVTNPNFTDPQYKFRVTWIWKSFNEPSRFECILEPADKSAGSFAICAFLDQLVDQEMLLSEVDDIHK